MSDRISLLPDFKNSVYEGYSVNYIHRNFWKFEKTIGEWEDALSNAAMVYYDCRRRYGATASNPRHFMALFKRCMNSEFLDWASWETRVLNTENTFARQQFESTIGFEAELTVSLQGASSELSGVLKLIFNAPKEILDIFRNEERVDFFTQAVLGSGLPGTKSKELEQELRSIIATKRFPKKQTILKEVKPTKWFENKGPILKNANI